MSDQTEPDTGAEEQPDRGTTSQEPDRGVEELIREVEKWKSAAHKHEQRSKEANELRKELEQFKRQTMSDAERAVAEARAEERAKITREFGVRLVDSELRSAAVGRGIDADALIEGVDRSRFLTDEHEPNRDAIVAWLDKVAPLPKREEEQPTSPIVPMVDLGQGSRSSAPLNGEPLERMLRQALGMR